MEKERERKRTKQRLMKRRLHWTCLYFARFYIDSLYVQFDAFCSSQILGIKKKPSYKFYCFHYIFMIVIDKDEAQMNHLYFCKLRSPIMPILFLVENMQQVTLLLFSCVFFFFNTETKRKEKSKFNLSIVAQQKLCILINPSGWFSLDSVASQVSLGTAIRNIWIKLWTSLIAIFGVIFKCRQKQ